LKFSNTYLNVKKTAARMIRRWTGCGLGTWQVVLDRLWYGEDWSLWSWWTHEETDYLDRHWQATRRGRLPGTRVHRWFIDWHFTHDTIL